jgi:hypothetical protein
VDVGSAGRECMMTRFESTKNGIMLSSNDWTRIGSIGSRYGQALMMSKDDLLEATFVGQ